MLLLDTTETVLPKQSMLTTKFDIFERNISRIFCQEMGHSCQKQDECDPTVPLKCQHSELKKSDSQLLI